MGLFGSGNHDSGNDGNLDIKRLRRDLEDEFMAQSVTFSGGLGFLDMCEVQDATPEQLVKIAQREGVNLNRYRK